MEIKRPCKGDGLSGVKDLESVQNIPQGTSRGKAQLPSYSATWANSILGAKWRCAISFPAATRSAPGIQCRSCRQRTRDDREFSDVAGWTCRSLPPQTC